VKEKEKMNAIKFNGIPGIPGSTLKLLKASARSARFASQGEIITDNEELESIGSERLARLLASGAAEYVDDAAPSSMASPASSSSSPLTDEERAKTDAQVLGFDSAGDEIKISDFRSQGYNIFALLSSPGPMGRALIEAFATMPDCLASECAELGIDYPKIARYALSVGHDPTKVYEAEVEYRRSQVGRRV
jgi:hypothetical protein